MRYGGGDEGEQVVSLLVDGGHLRGFLAGGGLVDGVGQQLEVAVEGRAQLGGDAQRVVRVEADLVGRFGIAAVTCDQAPVAGHEGPVLGVV